MDKNFDELDVAENSFTLPRASAIEYLNYAAHTRTDQILDGEDDGEDVAEFMSDIYAMKKDIIEHDYEYVKFFANGMSASGIEIIPMIEGTELRYAVEDVAEWVMNNLDDPVPIIFKSKKNQSLLEHIIKERKNNNANLD